MYDMIIKSLCVGDVGLFMFVGKPARLRFVSCDTKLSERNLARLYLMIMIKIMLTMLGESEVRGLILLFINKIHRPGNLLRKEVKVIILSRCEL